MPSITRNIPANSRRVPMECCSTSDASFEFISNIPESLFATVSMHVLNGSAQTGISSTPFHKRRDFAQILRNATVYIFHLPRMIQYSSPGRKRAYGGATNMLRLHVDGNSLGAPYRKDEPTLRCIAKKCANSLLHPIVLLLCRKAAALPRQCVSPVGRGRAL